VDAMKKLAIMMVISTALISSAAGASIFSLDVEIYENNTVNLNSFNITDGETSEQTPGDYVVRTVNSDGEILVDKNFSIRYTVLYNIDPKATTGNTSIGPEQTSEYRRKLLRLPYSYEAESIEVLKSGEEIYSLEIPERVCEDNDDTCPEYCDGKEIDSDCNPKDSKGFFETIINFLRNFI
jgi:hypothetical protein